MIEFYHVSKAYNGWPALHDVSFKIDKGEFVFLTGHSGAGKTTLLRLIFRADAPDEGQILVNNRNLLHIRESEVPYLRRMIGFVFQDFRLLPKKTVFENVALALKVTGMPEGVLRVKVAETERGQTKATPEYRDCKRIAEQTGRPVREIMDEAALAYQRAQGKRKK